MQNLNYFLKEAKKLASQDYSEERCNYDDKNILPKDFYKHQIFLINDCIDSAKKIIIDMIDTSSLEDLIKAKIILNKIIKISDNYYNF